MQYYYFMIPGLYIHLQHIVVGLWLVYLGYLKLTSKSYNKIQDKVLYYLGLLVLVYFLYLTYKLWDSKLKYSLNVPKSVVFLLHILNGLAFMLIGSGKLKKYAEINGLYMVIMGSLSLFYHAHLMLLNDHKH